MTSTHAKSEIWILGATGRCGRAIAKELAAKKLWPVLLGRDRQRLQALADSLGGQPRIVVADSLPSSVAEIQQGHPAVVINTVGPFLQTTMPVVRALLPGSGYVDLSNELFAMKDLLALHEEAVASGRCLVTGAGWGVLGTESVVLKLCAGKPAAADVRVEAVPLITGSDIVGEALAATILDSLAAGGWRYENGKLVGARVGGDGESLTMPDGTTAQTGLAPSGELEAAQRASGAPSVVGASSELPTGAVAQMVLPALSKLLAWRAARNFLVEWFARVRFEAPTKKREFSWAHARVKWPDGSLREGWLRAGEGMDFTARTAAEVAARLVGNQGKPGAYTPGALFGPELAEAAGGQFVLPTA